MGLFFLKIMNLKLKDTSFRKAETTFCLPPHSTGKQTIRSLTPPVVYLTLLCAALGGNPLRGLNRSSRSLRHSRSLRYSRSPSESD